uniref:Uncharacterized protein n=1 Tax=viral metagenome TaxID=1070528 RepID=A0A6C0ILI3_9ZZZZ
MSNGMNLANNVGPIRSTIAAYKGALYTTINDYLRSWPNIHRNLDIERHIFQLDTLMQTYEHWHNKPTTPFAPYVPHTTVLYRGINNADLIMQNNMIVERGYSSASLSEDVAQRFAIGPSRNPIIPTQFDPTTQFTHIGSRIILRFTIPHNIRYYPYAIQQDNIGEQEYVIQRGLVYTLTGVFGLKQINPHTVIPIMNCTIAVGNIPNQMPYFTGMPQGGRRHYHKKQRKTKHKRRIYSRRSIK